MSSYRSYYDYRKSYDRNTNAPTSKPKDEPKDPSKYATTFRPFLLSNKPDTNDRKLTKEMRSKYGPEGYTPRTDPPVSYLNPKRTLNTSGGTSGATTPRSRGTSPVTGMKTEVYSTSYSYRPYTSYAKYPTKTDTKDDVGKSKEDPHKFKSSNTSLASSTSRRNSREDLTRISNLREPTPRAVGSYLKSYTNRVGVTPLKASTKKPLSHQSLIRTPRESMESLRGAREVKDVQDDLKTQNLIVAVNKLNVSEKKDPPETQTITIINRATSPNPPSTNVFNKRSDIARQIQKEISRVKDRPQMIDREIQTDRVNEPRYSRYAGTTSISTPSTTWSSYLDLKFNSPSTTYSKYSNSGNSSGNRSGSRLPSTSPGKDLDPNEPSQTNEPAKPPSIPKPSSIPSSSSSSSSSSKTGSSQHSEVVNKDFRKSVLNMSNPKLARQSSTSSSTSSGSRVPKLKPTQIHATKSPSRSRSTSTESSASISEMKEKSVSESTTIPTKSDSRTSLGISELTLDEQKGRNIARERSSDDVTEKSQSWKSAALEATPNGAVYRPISPSDQGWWLQNSNDTSNSLGVNTLDPSMGTQTNPTYLKSAFRVTPNKSGEPAWWLDDKSDEKRQETEPDPFQFERIQSGERAWWMDETRSDQSPESDRSHYDNVTSEVSSGSKSRSSQVPSGQAVTSGQSVTPGSGQTIPWNELPKHYNTSSSGTSSGKVATHQSPERSAVGREIDSFEKLKKSRNNSDDEVESLVGDGNDQTCSIPLGDRFSPDGIETNPSNELYGKFAAAKFISKHTNIDDLLRSDGKTKRSERSPSINHLDDSTLQLYKDGDYGAYLDLEASISEQPEEFDGFQDNRKNSIILRTQLSVRVHSIIEKLLNSESRELRRSLFALKEIFQEDKDLVHEFVQNDGLSCLIKVGFEVDQNYQNYILRALGQLMLYVDGMNGVIEHNATIQWLYSLIASKYRLVVKTALKLLLVFVEYVESNCLLLINAVHVVDKANGVTPWSIIMRLLKDTDMTADTELIVYAMTLVNKCLNGIPDQDTYYDQVDCLEEQNMENIAQKYMARSTEMDLIRQFQIYEAVLEHEDGDLQRTTPLDETIRKNLRNRKSVPLTCERRKSRRHSTGLGPNANYHKTSHEVPNQSIKRSPNDKSPNSDDGTESTSSSHTSSSSQNVQPEYLNGKYNDNKETNEAGVTPALKRRRERADRQRSFIREQETSVFEFKDDTSDVNRNILNANPNILNISNVLNKSSRECSENGNGSVIGPAINGVTNGSANGSINGSANGSINGSINGTNGSQNGSILKKPWVLSMMYAKSHEDQENVNGTMERTGPDSPERTRLIEINKENTVKDLTQKLSSQNLLSSAEELTPPLTPRTTSARMGDMSGLINKAKEGLAKSKSKIDVLRSPTSENIAPNGNAIAMSAKFDVKKTESELQWEQLAKTINRPLRLCDLDFTDLQSGDEVDILAPHATAQGIPPPPPPLVNTTGGIPPPTCPAFQPPAGPCPPTCPPVFSSPFRGSLHRNDCQKSPTSTLKKNKKTVKLFWKEVREDTVKIARVPTTTIWDELSPVTVDTQKLEHLFESRAKDSLTKKQQELNKNKEIIVLDPKRSNAINIGMTKLPPPRSIKTAILKMDATIMNREGIEKLLTMLPTDEERTKIQDAQATHPDLPLGSAEQFLLTLASISELPARLRLWAFKLDFECSEREIAEPLMDLKQGIELLRGNKTFRAILSTLLSIGIFLNGSEVKGFQIDYLSKVPEVKDTVHKHSLLHHLCHMVMEKFPDSTDLYSEIGAVTRVSKVDFEELKHNIQRLEIDCKSSWDHLKLIAKHDGTTFMKVKMSDFLADCAERIILLGTVHRRVLNRYHKFLQWVGVPLTQINDTRPNDFCRIVSEFALEYRTTRERVLQQLQKKASHRERNKTRGKMITDFGKFHGANESKEERADAELRLVLDARDVSELEGANTLPWRRRRKPPSVASNILTNGDLTDADDEILESLVKNATKAASTRTAPRERKRTRNVDRKSMRRTLKNGLTDEEKTHLATFIKSY